VTAVGTLGRLKAYFANDGSASRYECLSCRARFERQHQVCPECGGYDVRSREWLDSGDDPDGDDR
jgi:predicted amidophosphoribosyltransferase